MRVLCSNGSVEPVDLAAEKALSEIANVAGYKAAILPLRSVGVQGDGRSYAHPALVTGDPDWRRLEELSTRITNAVRSVNRVVYGIEIKNTPLYRIVPASVTRDRLDKLRTIDHIVTETLLKSGEYDIIWQMPVVLLPLVNEQGGECVVLRPIVSQEAMTARFVPLKPESLATIIDKAKSVKGIGDLFIDITHKPPATIEWE